MAKMNMIASLNSALKHQLERDKNVVIFGEDVGYFGGVFRVTAGLQNEFGAHRVFCLIYTSDAADDLWC